MDINTLYSQRFSDQEREHKKIIWQILCEKFFQRYIGETDTVLDLGAGYCDFINQIKCGQRIAVDINPNTKQFAAPGVHVIITPSTDLSEIRNSSIDVVFASNFFEHLQNKKELLQTFSEIWRILRQNAKILILQPNIRVIGGKYWDFFDHNIAITDRMLVEVFGLTGFRLIESKPRFLPFSTKSNLPSSPFLIQLYLALPFAHQIFGEQAWLVGQKSIL